MYESVSYDSLVTHINKFICRDDVSFMDIMDAQSDLVSLDSLRKSLITNSALVSTRLFNSLVEKYITKQ